MADKKEKVVERKEDKILNKISSFASTNKKLIFIVLIAVVVGLIAWVVVSSSVNKANEKKMILVSSYQDQLNEIISAGDFSSNEEFIANVEKEIKGSSYSSVKSAYLLGQYYAAANDWAKSYDYFMKAYNLNDKIYLANLSLFNAAVAAEEQGDTEKALTLYTQVSEDKESPVAVKALFNTARIYYQNGNKDLAIVSFQQLIDSYAYSEYSAIAKSFIANN